MEGESVAGGWLDAKKDFVYVNMSSALLNNTYETLECLYWHFDIHTLYNVRSVSSTWCKLLTYICNGACVLHNNIGSSFCNLHNVANLFPNVVCFEQIGHRGNVYSAELLVKVKLLWLEPSLSLFCKFTLMTIRNRVTQLTLNLKGDDQFIQMISTVKWPELCVLRVITDPFCMSRVHRLTWKTPKLKRLMIVLSQCAFPACMLCLPISRVSELAIVTVRDPIPYIPIWFFNFAKCWTCIRTSAIKCLRLYNVVPQTEFCINVLISSINDTSISTMHLIPCSSSTAAVILDNTSDVCLITNGIGGMRLKWHMLQTFYSRRLILQNTM